MKLNRTTFPIILAISIAFFPIFMVNLHLNTRDHDIISNYYDEFDFDILKISAVLGKIHIDNNWTETKSIGICTGNGTYSDPYVIEDLVIDVEGQRYGIFVSNSNVYFRIENCTVNNSGIIVKQYPHYGGIHLLNVSNSQLINNTVTNNFCGIFLEFSHNNTISGNLAYDNDYTGINVVRSGNNKILGNTAINNVDHGIYLGNTQLEIGPNKISSNNIVLGNIVNNNGKAGLYMAYSDNNNISRNTAYNNRDGIRLSSSNNNKISKNIARKNEVGLLLWNSDFNTISYNFFFDNDVCISGEDCFGNVFENNYCFKNTSLELIIVISSISGGTVLGVVTLLLVMQKRKRRERYKTR